MTALEFAQSYLEDLLSFFGLNTSIEASEDGQTVELNVPSTHLNGFLIGNHGDNLRSLQHLTNMALKRGGYVDVSVVVDIAGYKKQRQERLAARARTLAEEVKANNKPKALEPMSSYERRVVHQVVSEIEGVKSTSEGEDRDRHIIISPDGESLE